VGKRDGDSPSPAARETPSQAAEAVTSANFFDAVAAVPFSSADDSNSRPTYEHWAAYIKRTEASLEHEVMATRERDENDQQILDALQNEFHRSVADLRRLCRAMKEKTLGAKRETERLWRIARAIATLIQRGDEINERRKANVTKRQQIERAIVITGDFLQRQVSNCIFGFTRLPFYAILGHHCGLH
jgi:AraC-like DNA-binding protein